MARQVQSHDKPAARKVAKVKTETPTPEPIPAQSVTATLNPEEARDSEQEQALSEKAARQKAADKIGQVPELSGMEWVPSQSLAQSFGHAAIDFYGGDVDAMPRWRFSRRYLGEKVIIVDTFRTEKAYDEAQVEERRRVVKALGGLYAALGPFHTREPYNDKDLRKKYPSMVEQLGWR